MADDPAVRSSPGHPPPPAIDLNSDLGEGFGRWLLTDDEALLGIVSSANVACGFHAGDPLTLQRVCARAAEGGVSIGAQVSFRDLVGFGRRRMECSPDELAADVLYQLGALHAFCVSAGTRVAYLKPHGALYHELARDSVAAEAVVAALAGFDPGVAVLGPPGSALLVAAERAGLHAFAEGFPDRGYTSDATLVPRGSPGAVVAEAADVAARALGMVRDGTVVAVDGSVLVIDVASLCIHGDSQGAVAAARATRSVLEEAGVAVRAFA